MSLTWAESILVERGSMSVFITTAFVVTETYQQLVHLFLVAVFRLGVKLLFGVLVKKKKSEESF